MPITNKRNEEFLRNRLMPLYEDGEIKIREQLIDCISDKYSDATKNITIDFPDTNSWDVPDRVAPLVFGNNNRRIEALMATSSFSASTASVGEERAVFIIADFAFAHCECFGITRQLIDNTPSLPWHFTQGTNPSVEGSYNNILLRMLTELHIIVSEKGINSLQILYKYSTDYQPLYDLLKLRGSDFKYKYAGDVYELLPAQLRDNPLGNARSVDQWIVKSGIPPVNKTAKPENIPLARVRSLMTFAADPPKRDSRTVTDWAYIKGDRGLTDFGDKEIKNSEKKKPQSVSDIFNFNSHLQNSEEWMLRVLVRRYKPYTEGHAAQAFDDLPTFCNHTYFPVVIQAEGGDMYAAFIPCVYSSFPIPENILRHTSNYVAVPVPNTTTSVMVDFGCINESDINAVKAITSAFIHSNPKQMSYVSFCSSIRIAGASMGLAVAMAICGCPFVAATGYIASMDVALKDDVIGHIELLDTKVKLAQRENWPIVCSHNDLLPVVAKSPVVNASNMFTSAMMNNANRFNRMVPGKHVLLACTSLTEAIDMSVMYFKANDSLRMSESAMLQNSAQNIAKAQIGKFDVIGKASASTAAGEFSEETSQINNKPKRRRK